MSQTFNNHFAILQVSRTSSQSEILENYYKLLPSAVDKNSLKASFDTLTDPMKRKRYNILYKAYYDDRNKVVQQTRQELATFQTKRDSTALEQFESKIFNH